MIRATMVINTHGKLRLSKFYDYQPTEKQVEIIRRVHAVLCSRPDSVSNFIEAESIFGPGTRFVYKHYATLYFVFVFDSSENELSMLDLIQVLVETLDRCFNNVRELDIVLNYSKFSYEHFKEIGVEKVYTILDEIAFGGQVVETNPTEVLKILEEISKLEAAPSAFTLLPRSLSSSK